MAQSNPKLHQPLRIAPNKVELSECFAPEDMCECREYLLGGISFLGRGAMSDSCKRLAQKMYSLATGISFPLVSLLSVYIAPRVESKWPKVNLTRQY